MGARKKTVVFFCKRVRYVFLFLLGRPIRGSWGENAGKS